MLKYCLKQWNKNHKLLEEQIRKSAKVNTCEYSYLVELVVDFILNIDGSVGTESLYRFDTWKIVQIDHGDYQGTLLFLIPLDTYQPSENEYLMTYAGYGSCSGCDTLMSIQDYTTDPPTEQQVKYFMALCKDLVTNMIKPYNCGWRFDNEFDQVDG
jgi:hypothetical protein